MAPRTTRSGLEKHRQLLQCLPHGRLPLRHPPGELGIDGRAVGGQKDHPRLGQRHGGRPPPPPDSLAVTALEAYLRCPARYWYRWVLGLRSPAVWNPELAPDRRGTAFHRILQEFMERWGMQSLEGEPDREGAARLLHERACVVLRELAEVDTAAIDPHAEHVVVRLHEALDLSKLSFHLHSREIGIRYMERQDPSLEQAFMKLTKGLVQ